MLRKLFIASTIIMLSFVNVFAGDAKFSGKITAPLSDEIQVSYYANLLDYSQKIISARLDKDGNFTMNIPLSQPYTQLQIQHGDQATEIFIQPDADLKMAVNANSFDSTLTYSGKGAELANFMAKHMLESGFMVQFGSVIQPLNKKEPEEFKTAANAAMQKELDFLEQNKKGLPDGFDKYWKAWYQYSIYSDMLRYSFMHAMMKQKSMSVKLTKEDYKMAIDVPIAFDDKYVGIPTYVMYVSDIYNNRYKAKIADDSTVSEVVKKEMQQKVVNEQAKQTMPAKTREYYFANQLYSNVKYNSLTTVEKMYADFRKDYNTSAYDSIIERVVGLKRKMAAGQPAMDFAFTTLEGKSMKLSNLKGKVVYLDFWASWCGPCLRELPFAKKVKEHFKDKEVVFLNVSIDEDMNAWKNAVEKHSIGGIHTCEPGGWQAPAAKLYGVQGVPSYYLIDKQGKFAAETSPRPSETEALIKQIEALLN